MGLRTVLEWVLRALGRHPTVWIGAGLLCLGCPLLVRLTPLDPRPGGSLAVELLRTWALPASLLGTLAALRVLAHGREFLRRLPTPWRLGGELLSAWVVASLALGLFLTGAVLQAGPGAIPWSLIPGWFLMNAQLALWAGLCLRLRLDPSLTLLAFLLAVLVTPWGLAGTPLARASVWFDAASPVRLWESAPVGAFSWGLLPLLALFLGNRLLIGKTP